MRLLRTKLFFKLDDDDKVMIAGSLAGSSGYGFVTGLKKGLIKRRSKEFLSDFQSQFNNPKEAAEYLKHNLPVFNYDRVKGKMTEEEFGDIIVEKMNEIAKTKKHTTKDIFNKVSEGTLEKTSKLVRHNKPIALATGAVSAGLGAIGMNSYLKNKKKKQK